MRAHAERTHQDRPERHHDHKVEDVAELNAGKREQQVVFALRCKRGVHSHKGSIGQGHDCICLSTLCSARVEQFVVAAQP